MKRDRFSYSPLTLTLFFCLILFMESACAQRHHKLHHSREDITSAHHSETDLIGADQVQDTDTVHILSCGHYQPYDFVNSSGEVDGYIIAVLKEILRRHNMLYQVHDIHRLLVGDSLQFDGPVLVAGGAIDNAAWSSAFIRGKALYKTHLVTVVAQESDVQSVDELEDDRVGYATELKLIGEPSDCDYDDVVCFTGNTYSCLRMLFSGEVDGVKSSRELIDFYLSNMDTNKQVKELTSRTHSHYMYVDSLHAQILPVVESELEQMAQSGYLEEVKQRYFNAPSDNHHLLIMYIVLGVWTIGLIITVCYYQFVFQKKYTRWKKERQAVRIIRAIMDNLPERLRIQKVNTADLNSKVSPYRLSEDTSYYKRYFYKTKHLGEDYSLTCDADVTEMEVLSQKQDKSDNIRIALLTNLSHDLRTPLHTVMRFTQLLVDNGERMDAGFRNQCLTLIRKNSGLMLKFVHDISVNPNTKIPSLLDDMKIVNCAELLEDAEFQYLSILAQQKVELDMLFPYEKLNVQCYKPRLIQLMFNLIDNAVRYTVSGHIQCGMTVTDNGELIFFCRDTGVGISEEHIPLIFNRFFTVDDDSTESGLGLAICRSIVERVNGTIHVVSQKDQGSLFWVTLPLHVDYQYNEEVTNPAYQHILSEIRNHTYQSDE